MSFVVDIILILLFLFTMFKHARLGLSCSVLSAGRFFISVIAALLLCYPIAAVMYRLGVPEAVSGIAAFVVIFVVSMILSKLIIKMLSKIKIPVLTRIDKLLGTLLGAILGVIIISILSTTLYTVLEIISTVSSDTEIMNIYNNSHIFRHIYDMKIFGFIRNLF